jgi:hypothetical protein
MPTIPPGFAYCVLPLRHETIARDAVITWGVGLTDVLEVATITEMFDDFQATLGTRIDTQVLMGPLTVTAGTDSGEGLVMVGGESANGTANITAEAAPIAALLKKQTSRGGRRGRGRMFVPWCLADSSVTESGRINGTDLATLQTQVSLWLASFDAPTANYQFMYVLHSPSSPGTQNPTEPGVPNRVNTLTVDPIVGIQKRRLGRT